MQSGTPWDNFDNDTSPSEVVVGSAFTDESLDDKATPIQTNPVLQGQPIQPMTAGMAMGAPGQFIVLAPPSSAAKVIGILAIILGSFGVLSGAYDLLTTIGFDALYSVGSLMALVANGLFVVGGIGATKYQKKGIQILLLAVLISTIGQAIQINNVDTMYDQMLEDEEITAEEHEFLTGEGAGIFGAIATGAVVVCNAMCGLILAIPLMISNNGLDKSSLFG